MTRNRTRGRWVRRALWLLGVLAVAAFLVGGFVGCDTLRQWRYSVGAMLRGEPDYDALESEREAFALEAEPPSAPAATWTRYRGPHGDGSYDEGPLALDWSDGAPPLRWRVPLGPAYSSMVVAGGLVITMEQRRDDEAVVAFALEDGAPVWERAWPARFYEAMSKEGPRATPVVAGDAVVALGATGVLVRLDLANGAERWRHDLLADGGDENLRYGLAASPLVRDGVVLAQGARSLAAVDLDTGEERWRALDEKLAYATPVLGELLGEETVVVTAAKRVVGLDPDTGAERWSFPWHVSHGLACTQPIVVAPDRVLVSAGYGQGAQLVALAASAGPDGPVAAEVLWRSARLKTPYSEPVLRDGYVYGLDEGALACLEVASGRRAWKGERYGYGQLVALGGGRLVVVAEDGDVHLVHADPEGAEELESFEALDGGLDLVVPALAHGRLLLRNDHELVCFDLRPDGDAAGGTDGPAPEDERDGGAAAPSER